MSATLAECDCECAPNPDPCEPCSTGRFQIQCRTKSGVATLVGFSEYRSVSTPPKKYRVETLSGSLHAEEHGGTTCSAPTFNTFWADASGSRTMNDAGAVSGGFLVEGRGYPSGVDPLSLSGSAVAGCYIVSQWPHNAGEMGNSAVRTGLRLLSASTTVPPASCCGCLASGTDSNLMGGVNVQTDLSNEDTEEEAIERASGDWSAWGEGGFCCSIREDRGAGVFTFSFQQAEYRVRVAGPQGTPINIELTFTQTGGLPFTETIQIIAQGPEFIDNWMEGAVDSHRGKTICYESARILPS